MENKKILITGVTGNIGLETIHALHALKSGHTIVAGHYKVESAQKSLQEYAGLEYRKLDFSDATTFETSLKGIDVVFLLRPPQLADVEKYFKPFLDACKRSNVQSIVFLSVQGAENQPKIPHYKIEKLILGTGIEYVFLRPSYFMQNLGTTLLWDIKHKNRIFIPAGKLPFNWVDARDIGEVAANILVNTEKHKNKAYEITGREIKDMEYAAKVISEETGRTIKYTSPNLLRFYLHKRKQGVGNAMIFVMIMLHYLPRFNKKKLVSTNVVKDITGHEPGLLRDYVKRDRKLFAE